VGRLEQEAPEEQDAEDDHNRDDDYFYETHVAPRRSEVRRILSAALAPVNPLSCKELLSRWVSSAKMRGCETIQGDQPCARSHRNPSRLNSRHQPNLRSHAGHTLGKAVGWTRAAGHLRNSRAQIRIRYLLRVLKANVGVRGLLGEFDRFQVRSGGERFVAQVGKREIVDFADQACRLDRSPSPGNLRRALRADRAGRPRSLAAHRQRRYRTSTSRLRDALDRDLRRPVTLGCASMHGSLHRFGDFAWVLK
jgi:hypothetical protein